MGGILGVLLEKRALVTMDLLVKTYKPALAPSSVPSPRSDAPLPSPQCFGTGRPGRQARVYRTAPALLLGGPYREGRLGALGTARCSSRTPAVSLGQSALSTAFLTGYREGLQQA
jgi:hypothetical protein